MVICFHSFLSITELFLLGNTLILHSNAGHVQLMRAAGASDSLAPPLRADEHSSHLLCSVYVEEASSHCYKPVM